MRWYLLPVFLVIASLLLIGKLVFVQIFQGDHYQKLSDTNRIRTQSIHAQRGVIFDRNDTPLVFNIPGFRKTVNGKTEVYQKDQVLPEIATGAGNFEIDSLRQYPYREATSQILGYIGQISESEIKNPAFTAYRLDDLIGKAGIEQTYEKKLKGIDGGQLIEVDAVGKKVRNLGKTDPIPGDDITLTLDLPFQQKVWDTMNGVRRGAAIVQTPDGQILALVSKPDFDPNLFTMGKDYHTATTSGYHTVEEILTAEDQPLLNRAIGGTYPPGSTFKLVTAASGLQNNIIDEHFQIEDTGIVKIGAFSFANWFYTDYGRTEGAVDVVKAIKRSNDIFFYKLADMIGVDKLSAMSEKFGLGRVLGIDLSGEAKGLVPTKEWKQKVIGQPWYLGDNYHYGIGQGYLLVTPLQVNAWTQAIANEGTLYQPHLIKQSPRTLQSGLLSQKNFNLIRQGMIEACQSGGVAWPFFDFFVKNPDLKIDGKNYLEVPLSSASAKLKNRQDYRRVTIACKTGTAQHGGEKTLPHAWITLFAPAYNPQIVVTVLSESSGEGSNIAGPIAKQILEAWFTSNGR